MSHVLAGTSGFNDPELDFARLDCVEVKLGKAAFPSLKEAQRWRQIAPDDFAFLLRAEVNPRDAPDGRAIIKSWKAVIELARALDAACVIVPTGGGFRPTPENRRVIRTFFEWAHRSGVRLGWEPRGSGWSDEELTEVCREASVTHVVDPLRRAPVRGRPPIYRLNGRGGPQHRYTDEELIDLRRRCAEHSRTIDMYDGSRTYCVFGNATRLEDAARLRAAR